MPARAATAVLAALSKPVWCTVYRDWTWRKGVKDQIGFLLTLGGTVLVFEPKSGAPRVFNISREERNLMRKLLYSFLIGAVLCALTIPTGSWAFDNSNLNGTYAYSYFVIAGDPNIPSNASSANLIPILNQLGKDIGNKVAGKPQCLNYTGCNGVPGGCATVKSVLTGLKATTGDRIYANGVITYDGKGSVTNGAAQYSSWAQTKYAGGVAGNGGNISVLAVLAGAGPSTGVLCGGPNATTGLCGQVCTAGTKPINNCKTQWVDATPLLGGGGYSVHADGTFSVSNFVYLTTTACGSTQTYVQCCNDPSLAIPVHTFGTLDSVTGGISHHQFSSPDDPGNTGSIEAVLQ